MIVAHDRAGGVPQPRPLAVVLLQPARLETVSPHPRTRASACRAIDVATASGYGLQLMDSAFVKATVTLTYYTVQNW